MDSSLWKSVPEAPADPILGLNASYLADPASEKLDLVVGAYRDENGKPWVLPVVSNVGIQISQNISENHEYLPITGLAPFCKLAAALILGNDSPPLLEDRVLTVQALSGTGALHIGFQFLAQFYMPDCKVFIPNPTWPNHKNIVEACGLPTPKTYRYFDPKTCGVDFAGLCEDINNMPEYSILLLHPCAHNPTGADPSPEQWNVIKDIVIKRKLLPFFDSAYQGFASGSFNKDAYAVRLFAETRMNMFIAQSFAKNMGLYGERVGAFSMIFPEKTSTTSILSQLKAIIRREYSSPPKFGANVAAKVMGDPDLFVQWSKEVKQMASRINDMRVALYDALTENKTPGNWEHIKNQIGMFSYTGLTESHVKFLREKHHIYMTSNGRISMAGLNSNNVIFFANAIKSAIESSGKASL